MVIANIGTNPAALNASTDPDWQSIGIKISIRLDFASFQVSLILFSSVVSTCWMVACTDFFGFVKGRYTKTEARQILVKMRNRVLVVTFVTKTAPIRFPIS